MTFEQEASYEQNRILQVSDLEGLKVSAVSSWMESVHVSPPSRNQKASKAYLLCCQIVVFFFPQRFAIKNRKKKWSDCNNTVSLHVFGICICGFNRELEMPILYLYGKQAYINICIVLGIISKEEIK